MTSYDTDPGLADTQLIDVMAATFQMQTWRAADRCTCSLDHRTHNDGHAADCRYPTTTHSWVPMEDGAAPARWKPKPDAREAVKQAAVWAGAVWGVGIPAMQVVELPSGRVIWRDSAQYPDAGAPIVPSWQGEVYAAAQAEYADDATRYDEQTPEPLTEPATAPTTAPTTDPTADRTTDRTTEQAPTGHQEVLF